MTWAGSVVSGEAVPSFVPAEGAAKSITLTGSASGPGTWAADNVSAFSLTVSAVLIPASMERNTGSSAFIPSVGSSSFSVPSGDSPVLVPSAVFSSEPVPPAGVPFARVILSTAKDPLSPSPEDSSVFVSSVAVSSVPVPSAVFSPLPVPSAVFSPLPVPSAVSSSVPVTAAVSSSVPVTAAGAPLARVILRMVKDPLTASSGDSPVFVSSAYPFSVSVFSAGSSPSAFPFMDSSSGSAPSAGSFSAVLSGVSSSSESLLSADSSSE